MRRGAVAVVITTLVLLVTAVVDERIWGPGRPWPAAPAGTAAPAAWAAAPARLYIGLFRDDAVAVVDAAQGRVLGTIAVPKGPHGLVITPDGRKVYVSSDGGSTVSVIDTNTDQVVSTIEVGPNPHGLAIAADGRRVLVSAWGANEAIVIDTASGRVIGQVGVSRPHNAALSPDGRLAYVASQQQGSTAIVVLDLAQWREVARVPLDRTPRALDLHPGGRWLSFTLAGSNAVHLLDTSTRQVAAEIPVGASPHQAPFTGDGRLALVPAQGPGELAIVDVEHRAVSASVLVGRTPHWVAAAPDGRTAYVTNEGSNDVSVVDLGSGRVVATIAVGNAPRKLAVKAGAGRAAEPGASDHGSVALPPGPARLRVRADDYYFAPTFIRGAPGQSLALEVENRSSTLHNLSVPGQLDRDLAPGARERIDLTFPATGSLRFVCTLHEALGMSGVLMVARPGGA